MASVFHYTDASGAVGILDSQSLFASDCRYLNDSSEGIIIDSLLQPIFLKEVGSVSKKLIEAGFIDQKYYQELGSGADKLQVDALFRSIATATNNVSPRYILSFCRHDEGSEHFKHGLLSQWRGYADRGGVAFEFDEEKLAQILKDECEKFFYGPVDSRDVLYEDFQTLFNPEDYAGLAGAMIREIFLGQKNFGFLSKNRKVLLEIAGTKNVDETISKYLSTAPFLKHFGFHEEREVRISLASVRARKLPKDAKAPAKPVEFRLRNNLIVPFIRLFGEGYKLPIKSMIIGPHPHQLLQKDAIERLLECKELDAEVRLSEIPLRGY